MVAIYEWDIKIKGNNDSTIIFDAHIISQIWSYLQTSGLLVKKDIEHVWGPLGCQESHIRQWQARDLLTRSGAYSTDAQSLPVDFKKLTSRQEHHLILLQGLELISMGYMLGLNGRVTLLTWWTFTLWDLCDLISGGPELEDSLTRRLPSLWQCSMSSRFRTWLYKVPDNAGKCILTNGFHSQVKFGRRGSCVR